MLICDRCKEEITEDEYWDIEGSDICLDCFEAYAIEYVKGFAIKEVI